jgi:hypothetical protein
LEKRGRGDLHQYVQINRRQFMRSDFPGLERRFYMTDVNETVDLFMQGWA